MKEFTHNGSLFTQLLFSVLVYFLLGLQEVILFVLFLSAFTGNEMHRSEFYLIFSTLSFS